MKKSRKRRLSLRQLIHIDIGTVIFFIILIYLLFSIMVYLTSRKTAVYEVRMGTLSENAAYRGSRSGRNWSSEAGIQGTSTTIIKKENASGQGASCTRSTNPVISRTMQTPE